MNKNTKMDGLPFLIGSIIGCLIIIFILTMQVIELKAEVERAPGIYTQIDPPTSTRTVIVLDTSDPRQKELAQQIGMVLQQLQVNPALEKLR